LEQPISRVHLIFKTHLDIGFTALAKDVTARYFDEFLPQAMAVAAELRARAGSERFVWTTGAWLIYEYLERAASAQRRALEQAIAAGDIVWHALPFTTHSELMDESLFAFGLSLAHDLDRRFGRRTIAAKMTDVPGHTRAIVPLLAAAGVRFLHIGVNPASTMPDVPPVFIWRDPSGADVLVVYQRGSYGDLLMVPGLNDALLFAHTNDNMGPQTAGQVLAAFADARARFPEAQVAASTLDAFAARLEAVRPTLPIVTSEIGDTWIHGVGTDPAKVARFRELCRLRRMWLADDPAYADDPAFGRFSRALLLVPEHTWGMDEKTHLADYASYTPAQLRAARSRPQFASMESSWAEQRAYLDEALAALDLIGEAPSRVPRPKRLADEARARLAALAPARPDTTGYSRVDEPAGPFETDQFTIGFDRASGAICRLADRAGGREWADAEHLLGLFRYQTFSQADYDRFYRQYIINKRATASWSVDDYTKPGMAASEPQARWWLPQLVAVWRRSDADALRFLIELTMPDEAVQHYGCPHTATLAVTLPHYQRSISVELQWFDKQANRLPEALWLSFTPRAPDPRGWTLEKLGRSIAPLDVVRNGNRRLHALEAAVYHDTRGSMRFATLDAPLLAPGEPSLLNFTNRPPPLRRGIHFNLYNNIWGTNFPMWYGEDARFRFILTMDGGYTAQ
jgi:hypothetical protein